VFDVDVDVPIACFECTRSDQTDQGDVELHLPDFSAQPAHS